MTVYDGSLLKKNCIRSADVVVVGSGAGGAVTAFTLQQAGLKTVLIEEGGYFTGKDLRGDPLFAITHLYRDRGFTFTFGDRIPVPLGCCVGGTTMINSGTCFRTEPEILRMWEERYGLTGAGDLTPYYDRIEEWLSIKPVDEGRYGKGNGIVEEAAKILGWKGRRIPRNEEGCIATGVCPFGCPSDGKMSMGVSLIPRFLEKGGELWIHSRVVEILHHRGKVFGVVAVPSSSSSTSLLVVYGKSVVLSAGAFFTPALLLASGFYHPFLGKNLHIHPAVRVTALFPEEIQGWKEVPQSYHIDEFSFYGVFLQGQFVPPEIAGVSIPGFGYTHRERMSLFPFFSSFGALISDESAGEVRFRKEKGFVRPLPYYTFRERDRKKLLFAVARVVEIYLVAGAKEIYTGISRMPIVRNKEDLYSLEKRIPPSWEFETMAFHPLGTARAGDKKFSPVDPFGRFYGVSGLFVADTSLFPTSNRINPQLTLMALALRNAERWVKEGWIG